MRAIGIWLVLAGLALTVVRFSACVADRFDLTEAPDYYDPKVSR